jgi:hypothetical protein
MGAPFPGPWKWEHHPWLYEMHYAEGQKMVGKKSAQMGFTQWALNKTFFAMDVQGVSALYILPSESDASDFSADRFDKAVENSPHLTKFFSDVKNVGHKRAGNSSLFVRGSHSRSKLKSIDTALIVLDEMDEMTQENIPLAYERQSGQRLETKQLLMISTPTTDNFGIDAEFSRSTQEHYYFKCPCCSRLTEYTYPESFVIVGESEIDPRLKESHYICKECKGILHEYDKPKLLLPKGLGGTGQYIANYPDRDYRGFHVNQFYSMTISPKELAAAHFKAERDPTSKTEFFNSKLGLTCHIEGSKIDDVDIDNCIHNFKKGHREKLGIRTMGIDVGSVCHFSIEEWSFTDASSGAMMINDHATPRLIYEGSTTGGAFDFHELDQIFYDYGVDGAIIDAEPERRLAYQFACRHWGSVYLCDFIFSQQGRQIQIGSEEEATLKINRTSWMDLAYSRFKLKTILLPSDVSNMYRNHIKEPERVYKKDRFGNAYGSYVNINPDHFALTRVYSELALTVARSTSGNQDIRSLL